MTEQEREQIDYIISHSIDGTVSWNDFLSRFPEDTIKSDAMEEILLELSNKDIQIIEPKYSINKVEYKDYIYITIEAYQFKECIPEIQKYENGNLVADYLEGKSISVISKKNNLEEKETLKRIKAFIRNIDCYELEKKYIPIFINYEVSRTDAILKLHLDTESYRFLLMKSSVFDVKDKRKYEIPESLKSIVESLKIRENN